MNNTLFVAAIGALVLSSVVAARSDLGSSEAPAQQPAPVVVAPGSAIRPPIRYAQAAQAAPAPQEPAPVAQAPAPQSPEDAYMQDQAAVARINSQIDQLLQQPRGGFAVTYYAKPAPPPQQQPYGLNPQDPYQRELMRLQQKAQLDQLRAMQPGFVERDRRGNAEKYVIARPGDTVYATLDRAFNSDDPQAPLFVTIHDVDNAGIQGPLDGVRMVGNLKFSSSQGAIQFEKGYLPDGRPIEVKGIGISEDTARTGFAKNVDNHEIERYGGLLVATLVQGVGQVGQTLVNNNQQAMVDPNTGLLVAQQRFNPYQAAAGALLPAGQALTAVAAQGFNRPATITAPAGFGLGIMFVEPVVVPRDILFARNR